MKLKSRGLTRQIRQTNERVATLTPGAAWTRNDPDFITEEGTVAGFGKPAFFVASIDRHLANELIRRHHYSGRVVVASPIHLGVFGDGELRGVLQFGFPMNIRPTAKYVTGCGCDEFLELNRMWLCDTLPKNSETRALAYSMSFIRRTRKKVGWIQSFADERCGLLGVVYQAANFVFCGSHVSPFWELDGETYHNLLMTHKARKGPRAEHLQANRHRAIKRHLRQFRYIYFLKPHLRKRLTLPILPFPKHAEQGSVENRLATSEEGGVQIPGSAPIKRRKAAAK